MPCTSPPLLTILSLLIRECYQEKSENLILTLKKHSMLVIGTTMVEGPLTPLLHQSKVKGQRSHQLSCQGTCTPSSKAPIPNTCPPQVFPFVFSLHQKKKGHCICSQLHNNAILVYGGILFIFHLIVESGVEVGIHLISH